LVAQSLFKAVSKGADRISMEAMKAHLRERGDVPDELLDSVVSALDINGDGEIDLHEFSQGWDTVAVEKAAAEKAAAD